MKTFIAQAAADQYGDKFQELPNTGFPLFFVVVIGLLFVAAGLYVLLTR